MSRPEATSTNSFIHDTGAAQARTGRLDPVPKPRFRPDITEVEIMKLLPRPRGQFETQAMIRAEIYRELKVPCFGGMTGPTPAVDAEAPRAHNELEDFLSDNESAPIPRRNCGRRLLGLFVSAWSFWRRERDISRSIAALSDMDDRILRDIGIHRLQIPEIVRRGRQ